MTEWINSDGLRVRFGTDEALTTRGGEVQPNGELIQVPFKILLTQAATGTALIPRTTGIIFPSGARIQEVEIRNDTAATSGGSATLNIGLVRQDTTTTYDADGFIAALALTAYDTVGETVVVQVGSTGAGAFLGTTLANSGVLVFDWDTAAFTAGELTVTIRYLMPMPATTN